MRKKTIVLRAQTAYEMVSGDKNAVFNL